MMRRSMTAAAIAAAAILSGCVSGTYDPSTGLYARPVGGAPATENDTAYSRALRCLADSARAAGRTTPRLAVGEIADLTGRNDFETGRKISQGAALFAVTALTKAGVPTVERQDRGVSEVERQYAQAHLLSDAPEAAGQSAENFRPVFAGQIAGSRYYIVGGVSELNYNIRSSGVDLAGGDLSAAGLKGGVTASGYVMNIAIDLRLVDTVSQEVLATASYQKQLVGREVRVGVFDFLNGNLFDLSVGGGAMEPIQFAVRTAVERGLYDFVADLYGQPRDLCLKDADTDGDISLLARRIADETRAEETRLAAARPAAASPVLAATVSAPTPWGVPSAIVVPAIETQTSPVATAPPAPWTGRTIDPLTWRLSPAAVAAASARARPEAPARAYSSFQ